tara:strand:- start:14897 stop:15100 length:204 start_codon:yes stop_codon:yes gene_type:complete
MSKLNDPRHEIAMAIHHISVAKDGLERGEKHLPVSTVAVRMALKWRTNKELEAAISWLTEAQEIVNK